jgi:uncharacterized protein (TIGR03086 family)
MSEISERYDTVATGFATRLDGIGTEQWDRPTPCTDWSVRDLVAHVVETHRRVLASLDGGEPETVDRTGDLPGQYAAAHHAVGQALADPGRAGTTVGGMFGEQPFESLVGRLLCADTLIHTWDLARATGQDERLDERAVTVATEFLTPIDDAIRRPGGFAAKVPAPEGADEQTKLLSFSGRPV